LAKLCSHPDCKRNQFGGGYCDWHQWCRTDKKIKSLRRTAIRKTSKKQRKILGERKLQNEKDKLFYAEIWNERKHFCYESKIFLGNEPRTTFFHHVLPKGTRRFARYRYCKWNIVLISWASHSKAENRLKFAPRTKAYRDFLIKNLDEIEKGNIIPEPENISI
jgi:hypothetical protein